MIWKYFRSVFKFWPASWAEFHTITIAALMLFVGLCLAPCLRAQSQAETPALVEKSDIVLLLEAPSELPKSYFTERIKAAIESSPNLGYEDIQIEAKTAFEFAIMQHFAVDPGSQIPESMTPDLEPLDGGNQFRFNIRKPSGEFVRLEIWFSSINGEPSGKMFGYEPVDSVDFSNRPGLAVTSKVGQYTLSCPPGWIPEKYQVVYRKDNREEPEETKEWPRTSRYMIRILGFHGGLSGKDQLFAKLSDESQANAFKFIGSSKPVLFANLETEKASRGAAIQSHSDIITIRLPLGGALGSPISRVWVCFPLSGDTLAEMRNQLNSHAWEPSELASAIRGIKKNQAAPVFKSEFATEGVMSVLKPSDRGKWFEIPQVKGAHDQPICLERSFRIAEPDVWSGIFQKEGPPRAFFVYESIDNQREVAVFLKDPGGRLVSWVEQDFNHWLVAVQGHRQQATKDKSGVDQ